VWYVSSFLLLLWFLLSHTSAAQLLTNSCSPLRFAWTTWRRSARGISVRLTSFSRSPALADLTTRDFFQLVGRKIYKSKVKFRLSSTREIHDGPKKTLRRFVSF